MNIAGVPVEAKARIVDALEFGIRAEYGAGLHYIHGPDLKKRNQAALIAWDKAMLRNAKLPVGDRKTPKQLRDEVCNAFGFKRATLFAILAARKQIQKTS